jgi:signal transduction histidine kinase
MIASTMERSRPRGFWIWYAAAWLPMLAVYAFAFLWQGRMEGWSVLVAALGNVLPEALLGIGVVHVSRGVWRAPDRRAHGTLALAGLAFVGCATGLKTALSIHLLRREGLEVSWSSYDRSILLWQGFLGLLSFTVLTSVVYGLTTAARWREEAARRAQAELMRVRSELKALRSQLNPHFLFNALHSLGALMRENPEAAERALDRLGDLLRYSLRVQDAAEEGVLLSEEWEFVRAYLDLEKLRLGERLRVELEASPETLECVVPAFVLQPLAENAVRHGVNASGSGGTIRIQARMEGADLELEVRDDGPGDGGSATAGTGRGLELVRQRVRALYGERGAVEVRSQAGQGFRVRLRLPRNIEGP